MPYPTTASPRVWRRWRARLHQRRACREDCEAGDGVLGELQGRRAAPRPNERAWVFCSTRVPIAALFENLRDGASVEDLLAWFPGDERSQVEAVLNAEAAAARSARG